MSQLLEGICDDTFSARVDVLEEAGRGGMGVVYRARLRADGAEIAIKELAGSDRVDLERFLKEADVLEQLEHPNIVRYREHGAMRHGRHYLAIDWLAGESLRARLERGALPVALVVELGRQVADALAHAHRAGIVHRDLKPGNLMLIDGAEPRVVLVDFGIARRIDAGDETLTRTGQIVGTPGYFSPEQLTAGATIEGRTDVFALGCVLHEMLSGERAFRGEDVVQLLVEVMTRDPVPVADLCPAVPERLATLVTSMLAKTTLDRPSAQEAAAELEAIGAALAAGDHEALAITSPLARTLRPTAAARPARWAYLAGGAGVAALAGLGVWATQSNVPAAADVSPISPVAASSAKEPCDRDDRTGCPSRCDSGDAESCLQLGEAMVHGTHGFERDRVQGLAKLREACDDGVGRGCLSASTILRLESGDAPIATWAADYAALLVRGCELGLGNSCRRLATELYDGKPLARDEARAITVGERGCDLGDNYACRAVADWHGKAGDAAARTHALVRACDRHDELACKAIGAAASPSADR